MPDLNQVFGEHHTKLENANLVIFEGNDKQPI